MAFKALVALDEAGSAINAGGIVPPSAQLRFLLAYLHDIAGPADDGRPSRDSLDTFWRAVTRYEPGAINPHAYQGGRRNDVHTWIVSIARRIGLPLDIDLTVAVSHARSGRPPHPRNDYDDHLARVAEKLSQGR